MPTHVTVRVMTAEVGSIERLLSIDDLAELLGVPVWTVRRWRAHGTGPKGIRVGKYVRYRPEDVRAWLAQQAEVASR